MIDVEKTAQAVAKSWRTEYRNTFRLFSDILQRALVSAEVMKIVSVYADSEAVGDKAVSAAEILAVYKESLRILLLAE